MNKLGFILVLLVFANAALAESDHNSGLQGKEPMTLAMHQVPVLPQPSMVKVEFKGINTDAALAKVNAELERKLELQMENLIAKQLQGFDLR